MIKNHKFLSLFAITLCAALLLSMGGKATRVYALVDPNWEMAAEIAPVFDTQIIQLQDYIQNNMTQPQFEVFNVLLGLYVAAQGGFSEYKLHDPYTTQDGILGWLKSCGIQLYNSLIGMNAIGVDPITGIDYRPYIKGAADIAMGCAVKSTQYTDVTDFVSDVNVQEKYFVPIDFGIQGALNYVFSKNGGMYEWQFETSDFTTNLNYPSVILAPTSTYWTLLASYPDPRVRFYMIYDSNYRKNGILDVPQFGVYRNLLLNTTTGQYGFYDDNGNKLNSFYMTNSRWLYVASNNSVTSESAPQYLLNTSGTYPTLSTYPDIIQQLIDTQNLMNPDLCVFINDFVQHYYYGPNWNNKTEIFHTTNLNLDPNSLPYYQQVGNNYLLDIKGILQNLLNTVDLKDVILNNIYDLTGVVVTDPYLTQVAIEILEEIQTINVPIPVNLNEISDYTENTYLDLVKEHGENFGEIIGEYVAFWHNADAEITYVIFGALILTLIGAFVGKWGHS